MVNISPDKYKSSSMTWFAVIVIFLSAAALIDNAGEIPIENNTTKAKARINKVPVFICLVDSFQNPHLFISMIGKSIPQGYLLNLAR